jgi:hypothetical protein
MMCKGGGNGRDSLAASVKMVLKGEVRFFSSSLTSFLTFLVAFFLPSRIFQSLNKQVVDGREGNASLWRPLQS